MEGDRKETRGLVGKEVGGIWASRNGWAGGWGMKEASLSVCGNSSAPEIIVRE